MSRRARHVAGLSPAEFERAQRAVELLAAETLFNPQPRRELTPEERKAKRERWRRNVQARKMLAEPQGS